MTGDRLLIVTSKDDSHADYVIGECNRLGLGERIIRLNTEDFLTNCVASYDGTSYHLELRDSRRVVTSSAIWSVWYRRPQDIATEPGQSEIAEFLVSQAAAFLRGLYFSTHDTALWVNPLPALHRSRNKLQQLQLAARLGLNVPRTLATNDPKRASDFAQAVGSVCVKSLDEASYVIGGRVVGLLTQLVAPSEIAAEKASISACPVLLQEYIDKRVDLRVVIFGSEFRAFEILSQQQALSRHDVRGLAPQRLEHRARDLSPRLASALFRFVAAQGLVFSAIDLVEARDGTIYFLENNPNGQWLWLQLLTGVRLSDCLIRLLLGG